LQKFLVGSFFMHGASFRLGVFVFALVFVGMAGKVERAAAGGQEAARSAQSTAAAQPIEATPESVRFENVPIGELYTQMVRLSNQSNARVKITSIASSAEEFAISGVSLPVDLEPGATVNFTAAYKPKAARNLTGRVSIATDLGAAPLEIEVRATGAAKEFGLAINQTSVDFGVVAIGKKDTKELELENRGNADVAISKISVSGANFSVIGGGSIKLGPGQKSTVQLQFGPDNRGGRDGKVSIFSNAQDSPLEIAVSGAGAAMSGHTVELKWEESLTSVAGYNIYRSSEPDGSYTKLEASPVGGASYTDTGLAAGQTYFYRIMAVDANNVESESSEQISVTVPLG
jgi:Abnormal spindle-like microcephaly-assoc'd, ASPM-SPD-2-Hydin